MAFTIKKSDWFWGIVIAATWIIAIAALVNLPKTRTPSETEAQINSPEILPDHRVTFRIFAPKATEVFLWGEWMQQGGGEQQKLPLAKNNAGVWSITIGPLPPDIYNYNFVVDGVMVAPSRLNKVGAIAWKLTDLLEIPGAEADFEAIKDVPHGDIHIAWYRSNIRNEVISMYVYTPPGYEQNNKRYPVLYLLHGGDDQGSAWSTTGRAGFIMDNLLAANKAKPMVIVMPAGHSLKDEVMKEIIPFVEQHYRVATDRQHRAIAGTSLGGGVVLDIFISSRDAFSYVGTWQTGVAPQDNDIFKKWAANFLSDASTVNRQVKLFSINIGNRDDLLPYAQNLQGILNEHGVKNEFHISDGAHTWINGRHYLGAFLPRLFQ